MTMDPNTARALEVSREKPRLALAFGLVVGPLLAYGQIELDLLWTGIIAGTAAYGVHRWREAVR